MPDIPDRDEYERQYARALSRILKRYAGNLLEQLGDPPSLDNLTDDFWNSQAQELLAVLSPFGEKVFLEAAQRVMEANPVGIDWGLVSERAADWSSRYAFDLVRNINDVTKRQLQQAVNAYFTEGQTRRQLEDQIGRWFGPVRAEAIAVTEVSRSAVWGEFGTASELWKSGIQMIATWQTNQDELVCFPAWTLITTTCGDVPIQQVRPGDQVMTRNGWKTVLASSKRPYVGAMRSIKAGGCRLTATANHLIWTLKQGWLEIGKVAVGDAVYLCGDKIFMVERIVDFILANPKNLPASGVEVARLPGISFDISMPIFSINLQREAQSRKDEVNGIAPHAGLLGEPNPKRGKGEPDFLFNGRFPLSFVVAGQGAKAPVDITGQHTKRHPAGVASPEHGRSSTLLGAVMPVKALFGNEDLATSLANGIFGFGNATSAAANGVSVGNGGTNLKGIPTLQAGLRNQFRRVCCIITSTRAVFSTFFGELGNKIKLTSTLGALDINAHPVSFLWSKLHIFISGRHGIQLLSDINILYHRLFSKPMIVYDLQISDANEFYANGILVHNCPICKPLNGRDADRYGSDGTPYWIHPETRIEYSLDPPHPRDRCWRNWRLPKVR